jgi:hypothetical protein
MTSLGGSVACQGGFSFSGGAAALQGTVGDYADKKATATLRIGRND